MSWFARLRGRRREPEVPAAPPAPTTADIVASAHQVEQQIAGKVPAAVTARVLRITRTVDEMAPRLDRLGAGSRQAHTVVATATSYLPEAVGGYLRLPRDFADRRVVSKGKTSAHGALRPARPARASPWTRSPTPSPARTPTPSWRTGCSSPRSSAAPRSRWPRRPASTPRRWSARDPDRRPRRPRDRRRRRRPRGRRRPRRGRAPRRRRRRVDPRGGRPAGSPRSVHRTRRSGRSSRRPPARGGGGRRRPTCSPGSSAPRTPTPYAGALADVVSAACDLGPAPIDVIARASATAAVQRAAVHGQVPAATELPSAFDLPRVDPSAFDLSALALPPQPGAGEPGLVPVHPTPVAGHDLRPRGEARQDPRGAARRARRARRPAPRQGRDPAADPAPARRAPAHRGRSDGAHAHPSPGVPGQPRHRQDDGRAAGGRHLPGARAADARATWSRSTAPSWSRGTSGRRP